MISLRKTFAILIGKLTFSFLQKGNSGGTAAPGLLSLKIDPQLLLKLKKQLKFSIIISGTNGKTTTTRMLASIFKSAQIPFYHNRTGSNLLRGITSTLIQDCHLNGRLESRIGLWEVDEAVLPEAIKQLQPKIVVLTNLFRDQLDRYGEIDTLAKKWQKALKKLPKNTTVILNADDPTVSSLGKKLVAQVLYYGIKDKSIGSQLLSHASDATLCPYCLLPLNYQRCFVSHLGIFKCQKCGSIQPKLDFNCTQASIKPENLKLKITCPQMLQRCRRDKQLPQVKLSGVYNVYNVLASFAVAQVLQINSQKIKKGYQEFTPAFGRFEEIRLPNGKNLKILLVKNPTGFNQVLKTLTQLTRGKQISLLIALNDLIADGTDVSWIWDVDMALLSQINIAKLFVSGRRYLDMSLRLKHANVKCQMSNVKSIREAVATLINPCPSSGGKVKNLYILPTYTAMLVTRKILSQMGLTHSSWDD